MGSQGEPQESDRAFIGLLFLFGFALRVITRLRTGEADFLENSYAFFRQIAETFLNGGGLCVSPGVACAMRVPVYPLFLAPFQAAGWFFHGVVVTQAAIGAALTWVAAQIGVDLFDRRTGRLAAAMAAFNPYALIHDTALQETALFNLLMAVSVWLLLRLRRPRAELVAAGAGIAVALATLTTAPIARFVPCAVLCAGMAPGMTRPARVRRAVLVALP